MYKYNLSQSTANKTALCINNYFLEQSEKPRFVSWVRLKQENA